MTSMIWNTAPALRRKLGYWLLQDPAANAKRWEEYESTLRVLYHGSKHEPKWHPNREAKMRGKWALWDPSWGYSSRRMCWKGHMYG